MQLGWITFFCNLSDNSLWQNHVHAVQEEFQVHLSLNRVVFKASLAFACGYRLLLCLKWCTKYGTSMRVNVHRSLFELGFIAYTTHRIQKGSNCFYSSLCFIKKTQIISKKGIFLFLSKMSVWMARLLANVINTLLLIMWK